MAIQRRSTPASLPTMIGAAVEDLPGEATMLLRDGATEQMTEALPLYTIEAARLLGGAGTEAMTQFGWRTLLLGLISVRAADVDGVDEVSFAQMTSGPMPERLVEAAELAEREVPEDEEFELRLLESPELKIAALWLAGEKSLFVPYLGLELRLLDEPTFLAALRERAQQRRRAFIGQADDVNE